MIACLEFYETNETGRVNGPQKGSRSKIEKVRSPTFVYASFLPAKDPWEWPTLGNDEVERSKEE